MLRNRLKKWKEVIGTLDDPKSRPDNFQQLVLACMENGMNMRDASRVFGLSESTLKKWSKDFRKSERKRDLAYFVERAHKLGADNDVIAIWFGIDVSQVEDILSAKQTS